MAFLKENKVVVVENTPEKEVDSCGDIFKVTHTYSGDDIVRYYIVVQVQGKILGSVAYNLVCLNTGNRFTVNFDTIEALIDSVYKNFDGLYKVEKLFRVGQCKITLEKTE
jgi:hypothetical protein